MKIGIKLVSKNINSQNHKKVNNNIKVIILKIMMVSSYQLILKILINVNTQAVHLDQIYWMILFIPFMVEPWDTNELEYLYDEEN